MLAIRGIAAATAAFPACARAARGGAAAKSAANSLPPGRALAATEAPAISPEPASARPAAGFLAQLIATAQRAPQTRQLRRAEPGEATSLYAAAAAPAPWIGAAVYRSL
jgi:hypothetical protein